MKRAELKTIERAENDSLTGVLNRSTFEERTAAKLAKSSSDSRHALMMLDIDGFKQVNDMFGHATGDRVLIDIAGLLKTTLRRDDLLGRLGGDEFVILLTDIPDEESVAKKAKRICDLVRRSFSLEVCISASIGIAVAPDDGIDFETLYKKADDTLYYIKDLGRDNFAFYKDSINVERQKADKQKDALSLNTPNKKKRRMQ